MARLRAEKSAVIEAGPERILEILRDYHEAHPRILPRPPFGDLVVESGGHGAGTAIRFEFTAFGKLRTMRARVEEPEPGRILLERNEADEGTTAFHLSPEGQDRCRVTIVTEWSSGPPRSWIERILVPPFLEKVYSQVLANLDKEARSGGS